MTKKPKKKLKKLKNIAKNPNLLEIFDEKDSLIVMEDLDEEIINNIKKNDIKRNDKITDESLLNIIKDKDEIDKENDSFNEDTFNFEDEDENKDSSEIKDNVKKINKGIEEKIQINDKNEETNNEYESENHKTTNTKKINDNKVINSKTLNVLKKFKVCAIFIFVIVAVIICIKTLKKIDDKESFHAVSLKEYKTISEKTDVLYSAYERIKEVSDTNLVLEPTNLNLNRIYDKVSDPDEKIVAGASRLVPIPVLSDENKEKEEKVETTAYQIFDKLQSRYKTFIASLQNLVCINPVQIVRQYHYDGYSIIGKYNPSAPGHLKGKRHTYFIQNFTNVNMNFFDGDGNRLTEDNNIKDIMSMASVYSYYKNPYDYNNYIRHCYDLFDNSYSFVASISEVYYCSGCMYYDDITNEDSAVPNTVTLNKIAKTHIEQKVPPKQIPYKAGILKRMEDGTATPISGTYNEFINGIFEGKTSEIYNYCPGHVDLNLYITVLTLDASKGLTSIDSNYGNRGINFTKDWHGWDALKKKKARVLANKDWEKEYGIDTSYKNLVKPLTQEEINYYMNRLPSTTTLNRRILIETALKSVGKIPYYYGGKTSRFGYETNEFGSKVKADYIGRSLKGLDCSGWINWVYMTAFNKYMIKTEGTAKLAGEGQKITRKELLPGDLIVRPGIDSHVMMFLEWADDNKVKVIHENGSVDNVSIATFDAYYPHYRRILNS